MTITLDFDNRYAGLPAHFYTKMNAEGFAANPFLAHANEDAADLIGLDPAAFSDPDFPVYFAGNKNLPGAAPLAMVYAGHQFGHYVPQLGDGRALLLGQVRNKRGDLWDVQLKGSGLTPYSRFGDGRAVLRSTIREYLCGEALHGLGIPTTRALCIVGTGEQVQRETSEPGAILTRLSPSHIRFGHFEFFYYTDQPEAVRQLADHVIDEHFPALSGKPERYPQWFAEIVTRTARLMAQWQAAGFSHGVMNTDNMSILGLTIDYGPFGFMEGFEPGFICNHSDHAGRYAFDQQPAVGQWNLYALSYALQPLFPLDQAKEILTRYIPTLQEAYNALMAEKLGVTPGDMDLCQSFLALLEKHGADYTNSFRTLSEGDEHGWLSLFRNDPGAQSWLGEWKQRAPENRRAGMKNVNPKYILRNWVAETAIRAAEDRGDYRVLDRVFRMLKNPFQENPGFNEYAHLPPPPLAHLCVSCSS